jgi:uncharacterized Rmd1/YagE family protein
MKNSKNIIAYNICEKFSDDIYEVLQQRYSVTQQKDIIVINREGKEFILFRYGIFVCWGVDFETIKFFKDFIKDYTIEPLEIKLVENLEYSYGEIFKVHLDHIILDNNGILTKIAISSSIAQSLKLKSFENEIQNSIDINSSIPKELAIKGSISLRKKELSQKIGELFLVKSNLNLHYDLLDTPEFIWEYPESEHYYEKTTKYLDINSRVLVLNKKVEIIQELLDMLGNEQKHNYSSFLEWIIIILIAFEIIMNIIDHL